jgi:hypothetical protein
LTRTPGYCWGGESTFKLTHKTANSFIKGLSLENFPPTLRDAIVVTRALDVKFLWIDALCIYQDSNVDWENEAPKMAAIYSNAIVCLTAASSSSVGMGIFTERTTGEGDITCKLPWSSARSSSHKNVRLRVFSSKRWDIDQPRVGYSPWAGRGWTMQEQMLSWRILTYTHAEISWSCATCLIGEMT